MRRVIASLSMFAAVIGCGGTTTNYFYLGGSGAPDSGTVPDGGTQALPDSGTVARSDGGTAIVDGGTSGNNDGGSDASDTYLANLPGWPSPAADFNGPIDGGTDAGAPDYVTGTTGIEYLCTTTDYSLTSTPTQVVTFDPNVDVLWPGALLQGGPFQQGILSGLPITQRAPLTVSVPTLLSASNSQFVEQPNVATVEAAIGAIVAAAVDSGVQASSSVSYTQTDAYSASQVALNLGFSASYIGGDLSGQLNLAQSANLHSVVGYFVQNMFTVTVPEPETPGDLFNGLTTAILNPLIAEGDVGPTNLPIYVASVTYGRIMMFSISSEESTQQIMTALDSQFHGGFASGSVSTQYSALLSDSTTTFNVVTVGGAAADAEALIQTGDPSQFFSNNPPISTGVPISYVVRNLSDNSIAGVSQTTNYAVQTCDATAIGPGANYYIADESSNTVQAYDSKGNHLALTHPIQAAAGSYFFGGVAYDSADDLIYVAQYDENPATPSQILAFEPDGTFVSGNSFTGPPAPGGAGQQAFVRAMTYDPTYDRLYLVQENPAYIYQYTSTGEVIGDLNSFLCPIGEALYVPSTGDIYCTSANAGVSALKFATDAMVSFPSGSFSGLSGDAYSVYDTVDNLLFFGSFSSADSITGFTPDGTQVMSLSGLGGVQCMTYDPVDNYVAVAFANSTVSLFQPDGGIVPLPNAAFSDFASCAGMAYRP